MTEKKIGFRRISASVRPRYEKILSQIAEENYGGNKSAVVELGIALAFKNMRHRKTPFTNAQIDNLVER